MQTKDNFRRLAKKDIKKEANLKARCTHYGILNEIKKIIKITNSKTVLLYMPTSCEPDVYKLRKELSSKHTLLIPFMLDVSFKAVKLRGPFKKSKFSIRENIIEQNVFNKKIDIAIVPVVGVDGNMRRVGHGKGYYDMFIDKLSYRPTIVFVNIKNIFTKDIICEKHDIWANFYITPTKKYIIRGKNDRSCSWCSKYFSRSWTRIFSPKKDE